LATNGVSFWLCKVSTKLPTLFAWHDRCALYKRNSPLIQHISVGLPDILVCGIAIAHHSPGAHDRGHLTRVLPGKKGRRMSAKARVYLDGTIAGIIGAAIIALLFLFLDAVTRLPLYTPTVLGAGLFVGAADLASIEEVEVSLKLTLMYTWVHWLAFIAVGVIAAQFLSLTKRDLNLGLSIFLLFLILEIGFVGSWFVLAEPVLDELAWTMVLLGNLLAAIGMAIYLQLRNTRPALPS
jgi:hypothetical protein